MKNHQIFSANNQMDIVATSLISVYNTHVYGTYRNILLNEKVDMNCFILTLEGSAHILLKNGEKIILREKSVFFGKNSSIYALCSDCPHWHFVCYWFIPHNISLPIDSAFIIKDLSVETEDENADRIIRFLQMSIYNKTKYANSFFCFRLLDTLEKINPLTQKSNDLTDNIIKYINEHIEEDVRIKEIAEFVHYSEKHVRAIFNNTLHVNPKQYIIKVKLENVCHLLKNSDISLQELAEKYSFASVSHLVNSFKKEYNLTPKQYRNKRDAVIELPAERNDDLVNQIKTQNKKV